MNNTAAVAFGRCNPPTIAHELLVKTIAGQDGDSYLYLSHSQDPKENPLSYEIKLDYCRRSFSEWVNLPKSDANNMYQVLSELYEQGYKNIIYLCGSDRADSAEKLKDYNGVPDKKGNIIYDFDSIDIVKVGNDRINEDDISIEKVSASIQRKFAEENDFESFEKGCPTNLYEDERYGLFTEVREGMGLVESLNELHTLEDNLDEEVVQDEVQIIFDKILNKLPSDIEIKRGSDLKKFHRDAGEVARIVAGQANDTDSIIKSIKALAKGTKIKVGDFNKFPEISGTYNSLELVINGNKYYISIADKSKKMFTPNKIMKNIMGENIEYNKLDSHIENLEGINFKGIYDGSIKNVKHSSGAKFIKNIKTGNSGQSMLEFNSSFNRQYAKLIPDKIIPSLLNDFGEVLGAGCLSSVVNSEIKDTTYINFPSASNEPLVDYTILCKKDSFKVSEKAGSGAAPSCESIFKMLYPQASKGRSKLDQFIVWMYENVATAGMHQGFVNMAKLATKGAPWLKDKFNIKSKLGYAFKEGSITSKNIERFMDDVKEIYGNSRLSCDMKRIGSKDYCETIRVRYLARDVFESVNRDPELLDGFNKRIKDKLGLFIQVYLKSSVSDFKNGQLKFKAVTLEENGKKYLFVDGSIIFPDNRLNNKRLSIVMK